MDGADAVKYILENNIEGDIVECGVAEANMEYAWIKELMKHNVVRDIYLFDTFAGLTEPSEEDYTCDDAKLYKMSKDDVYTEWKKHIINKDINNWCFFSLNYVKNKLESTGYPPYRLHYVKGDVMKTLNCKENIPYKIAILRLDTDWYESSKFELEKLYDNVVKGGLIIFDDYYHWNGQRKATDEFFKKINVQYEFVDINNKKTAAIIKK